MADPVVKWAGGKRRLLGKLSAKIPAGADVLVEPFVGGGAFFLGLDRFHEAHVNDINPHLVNMYQCLKHYPQELKTRLDELSKQTSEKEYLLNRATFNAKQNGLKYYKETKNEKVNQAALFIFLNKACFNGLYRENSKGNFNVPWGKRTQLNLYDSDNLDLVTEKLQKTFIYNKNIFTLLNPKTSNLIKSLILDKKQEKTLIYLDPPYIPLNPTSSFTTYNKAGFGKTQQVQLAKTIESLSKLGFKIMLSNSDTPETRKIFNGLHIDTIKVTRSISASKNSRVKVGEIIATNY